MAMLRHAGFEPQRTKKALDMLLIDRKNEFRELASAIFWNVPASMGSIKDWEVFVMNFCLDVNEAFKRWSGQIELPSNAPTQALIILRQLSHGKSTMNDLVHLLNISYTLAEEFKVIYKRIE